MMNKTDAAWLAGIVDGEGTVTITRMERGANRSPMVSVCSTSYEIVERCANICGKGHITIKRTRNPNHSTAWTWKIRWRDTLEVLSEIRPHMVEREKIRRADLLLTSWRSVTPRNGKYNEAILDKKSKFEAEFFKNSKRTRVT